MPRGRKKKNPASGATTGTTTTTTTQQQQQQAQRSQQQPQQQQQAQRSQQPQQQRPPQQQQSQRSQPAQKPQAAGPVAAEKSAPRPKTEEKTSKPAAAASKPGPREATAMKKGKQLDEDVRTRAELPTSPAPKEWRRIVLDTNYFPVVLNSNVFEYAATFEPDLRDSSKRKKIIRERKIPNLIVVMGNSVFTPESISDCDLVWGVSAREAGMEGGVTVTLSLVKPYSKGMELDARVFAALFRRAFLDAGYAHIFRNLFDMNRKEDVAGGKYGVIPGVEVAVMPTMSGQSLVADVTNKVVRNDTILKMWERSRGPLFFSKDVEGSIVYTYYNNRSYSVKKVCTDMTPSSKFVSDDGKEISYADYVYQRHNKKVTNFKQPMLEVVRRGESIFLIPEFCCPTGFEDRDRSNYQLMSEITDKLFPKPTERQRMICGEVDVIKKNLDKVELGIAKPLKVEGTIIPLPRLPKMKARDNLSRENAGTMAGGKELKTLVIVRDRGVDERRLADSICRNLGSIGLRDIRTVPVDFDGRNASRMDESIRHARPDFVLFVSRNSNDKRSYAHMKMLCTHELKVPSQVVTERNISHPKKAPAVIMNVARQMAVKLGKCPWVMPFSPITRGTMVFGLDVCHTTPIHKSVVGMVASFDDTFGKYTSDFIVQDRGKEIVSGLKPFVKKALEKYKKKNRVFPKNILFLRDGVGDGQLMYVNGVEVTSIQGAIHEISPETKLSFVVVKKRIRTRLFDSGRNPMPGTLVDTVITHPQWYDFFLVSHETRNGTVSPTHYNVLLDEMKWPKNELQLFIYYLCYQYYNWDGSISVPAPCQYAHKMAFLYGRTLLERPDRVPSVPSELEETLLQI